MTNVQRGREHAVAFLTTTLMHGSPLIDVTEAVTAPREAQMRLRVWTSTRTSPWVQFHAEPPLNTPSIRVACAVTHPSWENPNCPTLNPIKIIRPESSQTLTVKVVDIDVVSWLQPSEGVSWRKFENFGWYTISRLLGEAKICGQGWFTAVF